MMRPLIPVSAAVLLASCAHTQNAQLKTPPAPTTIQRQITNAVDAGDGDAEMQTLRAKLIADPADLNARLELARSYDRLGAPELALEHYRLATVNAPESPEAQLLLARGLARAAYNDEAVSGLSAFLEKNPQPNGLMYTWLGILRDDASDWKGSERAYRQAMAKTEKDADYLHNNLGYALLKQGEASSAAAEFRKALKLNPHSEIARNNLGIALAADPELSASAGAKEAIVNWQSQNEPAAAHNNLAAVLIEQGKYTEARKELEAALKYNRTNPAALRNLELLSSLDGKPVSMPAPAAHATRWARLKSAVSQWFAGGRPDRAQDQTASQTAAKTASTPTTPESKQ